MRAPALAPYVAAVRALLALTLVLGVGYPLALVAAGRLPGLAGPAGGSLVRDGDGRVVGSDLLGQPFTGPDGTPLAQYLQPRPSAAGAGYDPTASGGSNLGPQDVLDVAPDPATGGTGRPSLLSAVCARSLAVGRLEGVDGRRPYCTPDGAGAVLAVWRDGGRTGAATRVVSADQACPATPFLPAYEGVRVTCREPGEDLAGAVVVPVRGDAPAVPAVPADAVTASASGLDPHVSPAYARLQAPRVARARGVATSVVLAAVERHTTGEALGFLGRPAVDVLAVNLDLDRTAPTR